MTDEPTQNDAPTGDDETTFRVEFLDGRTVDMEFGADHTESLRETLPQATTILGCPDCGNLSPVTDGIPTGEMPSCQRCGKPLHGVVEVTALDDDAVEEYHGRVEELEAMGVPERRAQVVALRERELSYSEIVDALGLSARGNVGQHLDAYAEQYRDADQLIEDGPDPDTL